MRFIRSKYLPMNKGLIAAVFISLLVGGGVGYLVGSSKDHPGTAKNTLSEEMPAPGQHATTPDAMVQELLSKTGISRDETFLENMIVHHESAVAMAKLMVGKTERPELEQLAQDIITSQTKEIGLMKGWLNEWYGR